MAVKVQAQRPSLWAGWTALSHPHLWLLTPGRIFNIYHAAQNCHGKPLSSFLYSPARHISLQYHPGLTDKVRCCAVPFISIVKDEKELFGLFVPSYWTKTRSILMRHFMPIVIELASWESWSWAVTHLSDLKWPQRVHLPQGLEFPSFKLDHRQCSLEVPISS